MIVDVKMSLAYFNHINVEIYLGIGYYFLNIGNIFYEKLLIRWQRWNKNMKKPPKYKLFNINLCEMSISKWLK